MASYQPKHFSIPPTHELRFELEAGEGLSIKLVAGFAEIFGFELVLGQTYGFSHEQRGAVWAPGVNNEGAEVEMSPDFSLSSFTIDSGTQTRGMRRSGSSTIPEEEERGRSRETRSGVECILALPVQSEDCVN
jgi:hypothetical protein